ncbi:MAG: TdeIII family type II restriction endonuclease, partial [Ignavibacteriaceae bacterium]|nr:TdeIII family type II restriction endonuclease [Ignavibacteriaceae bacterium]
AKAIADYFDCSLKNFSTVEKTFVHFKNSMGKQRLKKQQISEINSIIKHYIKDHSLSINEIWISVLIRDFVRHSIQELQKTLLENLLINPFLVKAFGFDDHKEVVTFYFYQKITRSIVTSWGFTVEGLLLCSGAEHSDIEGFDMKVKRNGKNYQLQIKSSPNTMSIEQVRQLNTHIKNIKNKLTNIPILGMTYGTEEQINSQIQSTLIDYPKSTMIGKELWDFIAGEIGYCDKLLNLIDDIMKEEPTKFSDEIENKRQSLIIDWERSFGIGKNSIDLVLQKYL